ncbi:MAG: threonine synthase [Euryarchaeota archaeon]|nr:threonine synthase [Euryarchaeota archaeon]
MARSFCVRLDCGACGKPVESEQLHNLSPCCGKPLLARYDLDAAREQVTGTDLSSLFSPVDSLWRYRALLPKVDDANVTSLGEGRTPLLSGRTTAERVGLENIWLKDEGQNPTGTFKARGMSLAVSRARQLGALSLSVPTAGNAGGALAAYAARARLAATVAMPKDAPEANKAEVRAHGAELIEVDGLINDCGALLKERAQTTGAFDVSTLKEPYRLEGKKTMGYELWEHLSGRLPDVIVYPTGGGTGLIGMWKAFDELEALGLIGPERPRMMAVQAEGCAPIVQAFHAGASSAEPWVGAKTMAGGLRVPQAIGDFLILEAVRKSAGGAVAVSDHAIVQAQGAVARDEGLLVAPEAAATLAGLERLIADGKVAHDEETVLFVTGSGLKHLV